MVTPNLKLQAQAAEIRLRAKRRIGELSKALEKSKGGSNPSATLPCNGKSKSEVLTEAYISTSEAYRCEKLVGGSSPPARGD